MKREVPQVKSLASFSCDGSSMQLLLPFISMMFGVRQPAHLLVIPNGKRKLNIFLTIGFLLQNVNAMTQI